MFQIKAVRFKKIYLLIFISLTLDGIAKVTLIFLNEKSPIFLLHILIVLFDFFNIITLFIYYNFIILFLGQFEVVEVSVVRSFVSSQQDKIVSI